MECHIFNVLPGDASSPPPQPGSCFGRGKALTQVLESSSRVGSFKNSPYLDVRGRNWARDAANRDKLIGGKIISRRPGLTNLQLRWGYMSKWDFKRETHRKWESTESSIYWDEENVLLQEGRSGAQTSANNSTELKKGLEVSLWGHVVP